jgi:hypothetical protein
MTTRSESQLTKNQKKAIAEQLANFFFDFWNNKQLNNKSLEKKQRNHYLERGFSEEFSQNSG